MKLTDSKAYGFTSAPDRDPEAGAPGAAPLLPFPAGELDRSALRMRPADFARLLEVSKQTVSQWVKAGKVTLRPDGLLDPRAAVRQLVRSTDPARVRSRVLAPILAEVRAAQAREADALATVADLHAQLAQASEDAGFHEQAADELLTLRRLLKLRVLAELDALADLPHEDRAARLDALDEATFDELEGRECLSARPASQGGAGLDTGMGPTMAQEPDHDGEG